MKEEKESYCCEWQKEQITLTITADGKCGNCGFQYRIKSLGNTKDDLGEEKESLEWVEALQVEVMEDYINDAEGLFNDEEGVKTEVMRKHYEKLVAFISSLLQKQKEEVRRETINEIINLAEGESYIYVPEISALKEKE